MRKVLVLVLSLALVVGVPVAVLAAMGGGGGALDRQAFSSHVGRVVTTSKAFHGVMPSVSICATQAVSGTVSVELSGAKAAFRVLVDGSPGLAPTSVGFNPLRHTTSFSFNFVGTVSAVSGSDSHVFAVQWRSPTGKRASLIKGVFNLQYQAGTSGTGGACT
jgi:hypothetical protein